MTIEGGHGREPWALQCDVCPEATEFDAGYTFYEMWNEATAEGWRASKTEVGEGKGEWSHTCPACVEAQEEEEVNVRKPKASR